MIASKVLSSASKIVFILMALTSCIALMTKVLPVDQFMVLTASAFAFYFSNKGDSTAPHSGK